MTIVNEEILFEWDEAKAESNYKKHGITFAEATAVFFDPTHYIERDWRHDYGEERFKVIGKSNQEILLAIICTDREGNIRLISARRTRKDEKEKYHRQSQGIS